MVKVDAIEGTVDDVLWYHYDLDADVLYLRMAAHGATATYAEETSEGFLLLRREDNNAVVGLTIVSWWKGCGGGALPDSIAELERRIEPWARKLAA
jgi:uncharacterized protein YuzE